VPHRHAIVHHRGAPPSPAVLVAELRLAGLVAEADADEAALEALGRELDAFEARWRQGTGAAFAELEAGERLLRRVQRLEAEVERLASEAPSPGAWRAAPGAAARRRGARPRATYAVPSAVRGPTPGGGAAPPAPPAPDPDPGRALKALHRRLARALHPDLAASEAERVRREDLMARANAARARGDLAALEHLADRLGSATLGVHVGDGERLAWLARRIEAVTALRARRAAERARLARSAAALLREDARRREGEGGDALAEARAAADEAAEAARREAVARLAPLAEAAASLRRRTGRGAAPGTAGSLVRPGAGPRPGAARGAAPAARAFAAALEEAAARAPWQAALALAAWMGEEAGVPPDALVGGEALAATWDAVRARWPGAPDLGRALASPPRGIEVGLRQGPRGAVVAGLQLASAELAAGASRAVEAEAVRMLARDVLAALGPPLRCAACGEAARAVHLLRVAGLDEVQGLVCPRCGAPSRTFWSYGEPEGLEALVPLGLHLGLWEEVVLRIGGPRLRFGLVAAERERLTAGALVARLEELCLRPAGVAIDPAALAVRAGGQVLAPGELVPRGAPLALGVARGAAPPARALARTLAEAAATRFRRPA
jgi:hypothetical protein